MRMAGAGSAASITLDPSGPRMRASAWRRRPAIRGKWITVGDETFWVRGVTYGTFRPDDAGNEFHDREKVERDLAWISAQGLNSIRTYTVPPPWLLQAAHRHGLRVMIGIPWEQHVAFLDDPRLPIAIEDRVRAAVAACAGHPAVLSYTIGSEIPASMVRWHGRRAVERFLERLYRAAKAEDPRGLVTYVNYPTTEYLDLPFLDLSCFNVYLESPDRLDAYLARLQNLAGEKPLLLGEVGLDTQRNGLAAQARTLEWQIRTAFAAGCAGAFVFAWTDEWHRGGYDVTEWDFGLTDRDRRPKPALQVVREAFNEVPFSRAVAWPRISVVVCSYNGARTIRDCLEGLRRLEYPDFETILVSDGSNDRTVAIGREYGLRIIETENRGLSAARNTGFEAATGEIVAYIDDDAYPDPHWLTYLAATFASDGYVGVGGPNLPVPGDGPVAQCVANAPGGPTHVLVSDREAEHIPGCNMAFRKSALQAIGGFDAQCRAAGDDVDVCWRLQDAGGKLGFSAAAIVWHHRRDSVRGYWKQQFGYGKAEAILERKFPEKYNGTGHVSWSGRLYGGALARLYSRGGRVYHGVWGTAPFQSVYAPAHGGLWSLLLMPEWYLIVACLIAMSALGLLWSPAALAGWPAAAAVAGTVALAVQGAACASFPRPLPPRRDLELRALTAFLFLLQPAARLAGRLAYGLTPWRGWRGSAFTLPRARTLAVWSEHWRPAVTWLGLLEEALRRSNASIQRGSDFDSWDLQVRAGILGAARVQMAVEEHGGQKQMIRFRIWPRVETFTALCAVLLGVLAVDAFRDGAVAAAILLGAALAFVCWVVACGCAAALEQLARALPRDPE
jgi:GT2 family glycosyltransferase